MTQGNENLNSWIETYTVQYSHDGKAWNPVLDSTTHAEKVSLLCDFMQFSFLLEVAQTSSFHPSFLVTYFLNLLFKHYGATFGFSQVSVQYLILQNSTLVHINKYSSLALTFDFTL